MRIQAAERLLVDRSVMQRAIEDYLARAGSTLWGKAFDVSRPEGRAAAAELVTDLVAGALEGEDPRAATTHTI